MEIEQLETDLTVTEQAVVDIKATAETMRQELQNQYKQRDATTVRIPQRCMESPRIESLTFRRSWKKRRHCMWRNSLI